MKIETFEQFMDLTLRMVKMTETNDELAIAAAATIGSLHTRGHNELALQVLATYEPKPNTCPRCNTRDESVLLDSDGEPYLCDECWEEDDPEKTESLCNCHLLDDEDLDNGSTCYHCHQVHKDGLCDCGGN